jgi:hypothetical protein
MRNLLVISAVGMMAVAASASTIDYNTSGSTLSCGTAVGGCVQDSATSISLGGITFTYNPAIVTSGVFPPSITSLGTLVSSGTGTDVLFSGAVLTIKIDDTTLGMSGDLPTGLFSGNISTASSSLFVTFAPDNATTIYGTLPSVVQHFPIER